MIQAAFLTAFVEGLVEYLFGGAKWARDWLKHIAVAIGIAIAVFYKLDLLSQLGVAGGVDWLNWVITGVIIGRGSNYFNDIVSRIRKE